MPRSRCTDQEHPKDDRIPPARQRKRYPVRWNNHTCARVGFLAGRGETSVSIAGKAGLDSDSVRKMCSYWGLPKCVDEHGDLAPVVTLLGKDTRGAVSAEAAARKVDLAELLAQMITNIKKDNLWKAVLDD